MLDLEKLMECVTEFEELSKVTKEENKKLKEKQEQSRQQKLEELFEFLKPYSNIAKKVSDRIFVEPFITINHWICGITIDTDEKDYGYGIYYYNINNNNECWVGYIEKEYGYLDFKSIAHDTFSSEDLFEKYIDGILLHKDVFEEKFETAIRKEMTKQTQDLKEKREKLLKEIG